MKAILDLFLTFFKLGLFTFGGGYAMIPQLKENVIEKKKWLQEDEFVNMLAISESTPGPIAINMATFVGHKVKGFPGALFATLGVVLPSLIIIFTISLFFEQFVSNKYVSYAFVGIKCAVAFLIFKTGIEMFLKMKKKAINIVLFLLVFIAVILLDIFAINFSSIIFILFGGAIGIICFSITNKKSIQDIAQQEITNNSKEENAIIFLQQQEQIEQENNIQNQKDKQEIDIISKEKNSNNKGVK